MQKGKENWCDGYKIMTTLGRGGNSVVKLVEKDDRYYAMKIFKPDRIGNPEEFVRHMKKEMEIVQGLGLNSVPRYYKFKEDILTKKSGEQKKVFFLVMEYIHGVTLFDFFIKMKSQEDKFVRYIFR